MRRGFWAGLSALVGLAILFSIPTVGEGANWGNPQLQFYANTPIRDGDQVTLTGSGFRANTLLTGFGALVNIQNERVPKYLGYELPLEVRTDASGNFRTTVRLDMLRGVIGQTHLFLYHDNRMVKTPFLPVKDPGVYISAGLDATAGTLIFVDSFAHGGSGEDPVINGDDVPLSSNSVADWTGELWDVYLDRYTSTDGTGTYSSVSVTNDVGFTAGTPDNLISASSSAIVASLDETYKSIRMTVMVWDNPGGWDGTQTTGTTQGTGWLSSADVTAPEVSSATAISLTQIVVTFSEDVTTPSDAEALDNWTVTYSGTHAVSALSPLGSSGTSTCTLTVADLGDYGATPVIEFLTETDEFEDASGNDCASTIAPHVTASDGIAPDTPSLTDPTSSTFLTGASMTWAADAGAGADASLAGIKLQGSNDGSSWDDLDDDTSSPYSGSYAFGTEYYYYRALAYDDNSNETGSTATESMQDAFYLDLTTIPSSVSVGVETDQWEVTVKDNYGNAEVVTQTVGLSTESSNGRFRATSGGPTVGSINLVSSSTGNFYYIDSDVGTWEIKVTNVTLEEDSTDFQITAGSASKLLVKLPGQAFSSGTGVTGTPDFSLYSGDLRWAMAGTGFPVVLYIVDSGNNLVYETSTRDIDFATTAGNAPDGTQPTIAGNTFPAANVSVAFTDGESTTSLTMIVYDFTQSYTDQTLTASDNSGSPTLTGTASNGFWTLFDAADHIEWVTSSGAPTTTPVNATQTAGDALPTVYIGALDAYDNVDTTYTGSTITTTGGSATPPTNSPSGTGQGGADAPNGNTAPDYATSSTWDNGIVTLSNGTTAEETTVFDADATGFRIRGLATGGTLDGLYTSNSDQFAVDNTTENYLRIEDTSGGGGTEYVDDESFTTDQSITFWSIAYDTYGNVSGNYVATWSSTNLTPSASGTSTNWVFNPTATASSGTLTAANGSVTNRTISNITVTAGGTITSVKIRTASGGGGDEVGDLEIAGQDNGSGENTTATYYAAGYNTDGLYVSDVAADWSINTITGGAFNTGNPTSSNSYTASSVTNQSGTIQITYSALNDVTGTVTVDATEPATVQGFEIVEWAPNREYVIATWTPSSSYDDGSSAASGQVADFQVRFSAAQIDDETKWNNATVVDETSKPTFSSGSWQIDMSGQTAGYYYYAIKTKDDMGYWSDMGSGCYTTSPDYSLPVTLSSFLAKGTYGKIMISWATESEVDALGFNLLRDTSEEFDNPVMIASYEDYPDLLCQGTSATGFDYGFVDREEVEAEVTYYYKLEAVDINGRSEQADLDASAYALPLPTDYALGPNFPNPFNPETRFELKLPETGKVTVTVYNSLGREVTRILDNQLLEAGIHQLHWNGQSQSGSPMPSGIYFARLQTEGAHRIMKMLLLK